MFKVLVVEDDPALRKLFVQYLIKMDINPLKLKMDTVH